MKLDLNKNTIDNKIKYLELKISYLKETCSISLYETEKYIESCELIKNEIDCEYEKAINLNTNADIFKTMLKNRNKIRKLDRNKKLGMNLFHYRKLVDKEFRIKEGRIAKIESVMASIYQYMDKLKETKTDETDVREKNNFNAVSWKFLPPGEWSKDVVLKHYKKIQENHSSRKYDIERLKVVMDLNPVSCVVGLEDLLGYVMFRFENKQKVILENPIKGNAIYIIDRNWRELSKLTKRELLENHSEVVARVFHRGDWFSRLQKALQD